MANEEYLSILKQGIEVWNKWRKGPPWINPDLSGADLSGADLSGVDLSGADLFKADLGVISASLGMRRASAGHWTTLCKADLRGADLSEVNFSGTNLSGANLSGTNLSGTNLSGANFMDADLRRATFSRLILTRADLKAARIGYTVFGDVDLSEVRGLETVKHSEPSYIDIHTVYKSRGNISEVFLRGAGVPDTFIVFMRVSKSQRSP